MKFVNFKEKRKAKKKLKEKYPNLTVPSNKKLWQIEVCKQKSQYQTREEAERYLTKFTQKYGSEMKIYECKCCTMFHLTTHFKKEETDVTPIQQQS
jgi:hypothetical protein